jgi:hypothetical protein
MHPFACGQFLQSSIFAWYFLPVLFLNAASLL